MLYSILYHTWVWNRGICMRVIATIKCLRTPHTHIAKLVCPTLVGGIERLPSTTLWKVVPCRGEVCLNFVVLVMNVRFFNLPIVVHPVINEASHHTFKFRDFFLRREKRRVPPLRPKVPLIMMTSSNGNIFVVHSVESPSMVDPQWNIWYWGSKWNLHTVCWSAVGCEWGTTSVYFGITYVCFIPSRLPVFAVEPQYLLQYFFIFVKSIIWITHTKS